jgi:Ser-tRNA(Ala) deacylase AlaX
MKAILRYTSTMDYIDFDDKDFIPTIIDIDSLEDLLTLQVEKKHPLIIYPMSKEKGFDFAIEVYDDYRE